MPAGRASPGEIAGFEFATASRIVFGRGRAAELVSIAAGLGRRPILVTGRHPDRTVGLTAPLRQLAERCELISISAEPTVEEVEAGARAARAMDCDLVVAIGGGSVIDAGKAIAALAANPPPAMDYLEVVGRGRPLPSPSLPCIAVPTTAGTGAEVTRNAVLTVAAAGVKASLRSPSMLPRVALVDPDLTISLPPAVTAATGMDTIAQLIEPFLSARASPLTDALCRDGLRRASGALRAVHREPSDRGARSQMAMASLLGGMALANAGLGAVHGFASPIGAMFGAAHGAVCAALLEHVLRANLAAMRARAPAHEAIARMGELASVVTAGAANLPDDLPAWVAGLNRELGIGGLADMGVRSADFERIAGMAASASSMKANPLPLTRGELLAILEAAS